MITIKLNANDYNYKDEVEEFVNHEIIYNANLAGESYEILEGENTQIDGDDEYDYAAVTLYNGISSLIMDLMHPMINEQEFYI